ncbi:protein RRNAD1 [Caerostris darwini]|uniref:Protein RRNAD1 n=1 Tax=Caerostris darwini TaxID=1538125 RepID=A0AAV4T3W4_9ARAC|nr:protein RRNAD1 [Caerostris darwini]
MDELSEISAFQIDDDTAIKYLKDVTHILAEYSWIYNVRNTDILIYKALDNIPSNWYAALSTLSDEDFYQLPFGFIKNDWPTSLTSFLLQCHQLGNFRFPPKNMQDFQKHVRKSNYMPMKVPLKKQFQIEVMASLINKVCQNVNCNSILDIGSGLGYLDQILHHCYNHRCIGLDSSLKYTIAAQNRIKKDICVNSMHHKTMKVTYSEKCIEDLKSLLKEDVKWNCPCDSKENISIDSMVMVGLHSCGNLTQDMMKLFCEMDEIVALVCVGCCYNKIDIQDFPMSKAAQYVVHDAHLKYAEWHPCTSGLRLAAHGIRTHGCLMENKNIINIFYRAVIAYYVHKENIEWQQPKRHIRSSDITSFEIYCKKMFENHSLSNNVIAIKEINDLYFQSEHLLPKVKILLVLQMLLQPLWEGFIIVDRLLYFREKSMSANVVSLWDSYVSSRNLALYVCKR